MDLMWQNIAIGAVVVAAIGYIVYHFKQKRKKKECCEKCPAMKAVKGRN